MRLRAPAAGADILATLVRGGRSAWSTGRVAETDVPSTGGLVGCSLCGHAWAAHFGGGPMAVWVTCCATPVGAGAEPTGVGGADGVVAGLAGPVATCFCRRGVEEFRAEAPVGAGGVVLCVTCGAAPAEDTQCRACREARQRASRVRFAARQAQLGRGPRRR